MMVELLWWFVDTRLLDQCVSTLTFLLWEEGETLEIARRRHVRIRVGHRAVTKCGAALKGFGTLLLECFMLFSCRFWILLYPWMSDGHFGVLSSPEGSVVLASSIVLEIKWQSYPKSCIVLLAKWWYSESCCVILVKMVVSISEVMDSQKMACSHFERAFQENYKVIHEFKLQVSCQLGSGSTQVRYCESAI